MPWLSKEQIAEARQIDLLSYLQEREPHELVHSAPGEYRTVSHGSLVISNGAWYWNRGKIGGVSALDYLVEVQGIGLVEVFKRNPPKPALLSVGAARFDWLGGALRSLWPAVFGRT